MDTSKNNTQPELTIADNLIYSVPVSIAIGIILSIFTLMTIVFNLGGTFIFFGNKNLQTFSDCLIVNLMLADGSIGLLVMPVKVILALTSDVWVWSRELCLIFVTLETTTDLVSVINTLIITLDRYWLVHDRQKYTAKRTYNRLLITCIFPWIIVLMFHISPHFLWNFEMSKDSLEKGSCVPPFHNELAVNVVLLLSPFAPVIAVPVFDALIYCTLRKQLFQKLKCLLQSGTVGVAYLSSVGVISESDAKSLVESYSTTSPSNGEEIEDSTRSQTSIALDDPSTSKVTADTVDVNSDFNVRPETIKPRGTNVTNSNRNADQRSESFLDPSTDGKSRAEQLTKAAVQEAGETGGKEVEGRVEAVKEFAADMQEARLSLTLGMVLVFTTVPFQTIEVAGTLCETGQSCIFTFPSRLLQGCRWGMVLNSTINPVLIFSLDHRYRAALSDFVCGARGQSNAAESPDANKAVLLL